MNTNDNDEETEEVKLNVNEADEGDIPVKEYDYLLSMPMWSVTEEKIEQLTAQMNEKQNEHDAL